MTSTLEDVVRTDGPVAEVGVAVIGAGFAGLGLAIRLRQRGERDFVVLERGPDVGGTWRDNTYPGAACDVQSHLYSFSFAPNPDWSRTYSAQPEIQAYLRDTADRFGVREHCVFGAEVTGARWDDAAARWQVETTAGAFSARVLVSAAGALADPVYPELPGLDRFAGTVMHSARWDAGHDLTGQRVAVVGTGASAVQLVPAIQPRVAGLTVYQRTAAWVVPRRDRPVAPLARRLFRRLPVAQRAVRGALYAGREVLVVGMAKRRRFLRPVETVARAHLERQVPDPRLRAALTPDFAVGCKRILISNDWYPALSAPNAELVTAAITEVRQHSVVTADGVERPTDTIVLATGFAVTDPPIAHRVTGRDGRTLAQVWDAGTVTNRGCTVAGFPNLFLLVGPNVGVGHTSMVYMIESQLAYVLDALRTMAEEDLAVLETTPQAQAAYRDLVARRSRGTVWLSGGCRSWYLDRHGHNTALWPDFTFRFRALTRRLDREHYVGTPAGGRRAVAVPTPDGASLHATVDGADDAPVTVVLAHGWTLAQAAWDDVAAELAPEVRGGALRLVRYDQRGHGRSTWGAAGPVSIDLLGADLAAVLDATAPDGPVVLGGHSMGGMTIMCLAAARPGLFGDRVRGVALVDTSAGDLAPAPRTRAGRLGRRLTPGAVALALAGARGVEGLRRLAPPSSPRHRRVVRGLLYGDDATDAMVRRGAELVHASTVAAFGRFHPALMAHDKHAELAALARVPVEVLVGEADRLTPVPHSRRLAEALPGAVLRVEPRCGHMLPQERPALVAAALRRLVAAALA